MTNLRSVLGRDGPALIGALAATILAGVTLTALFTAYLGHALHVRTADSASLLAQEALNRFADSVEPAQLEAIETGRDSVMTRIRVSAGERMTGSYTVYVARLADTVFAVQSTGRLAAQDGAPIVCSVNVVWRTDDWTGRPRAIDGRNPVCSAIPLKNRLALRTSPLES